MMIVASSTGFLFAHHTVTLLRGVGLFLGTSSPHQLLHLMIIEQIEVQIVE